MPKTSSSKSESKPTAGGRSTSRSGRRAASSTNEPAAPPATPTKPTKAPVETLSLIDGPKKKVKKDDSEENKSRSILPPISKIVSSKAQSEAPPAAPAEPPQAEQQPAEAEVDKKIIHLKPPIIVRELAEAMGIKTFQLIHDLMELNIFAAINQPIEPDVATKICEKHGFLFEKEKREKGAGVHKPEPVIAPPPKPVQPKEDELTHRAPIITMMGHVDHGKTSLLDTIRKARVAAGEAGGITQHIGAYRIERHGKPITFLDTPGHAAFTAMRARGANVTDIVILVVAADDGLMPQTIEAIHHAKAANATIIVAINKVDLPSANIDKVKMQLQEQGLAPEDWGGDTIVCPVSATKGIGVEELLDMITLQAEVLELKASKDANPRAIIIESQVEPGRGPTATLIVKMGTLRVGQSFICGNQWGKIKQLINDLGQPIKEAGPATPVKILGFNGLPNAGDELVVMESDRAARALSEERLAGIRLNKLATPQRATLETLFASGSAGPKTLTIVLKADVQGSLEALVTALKEIRSKKINLNIIHSAVGPITESDVLLASASNAVIIGFGTKVENSAAAAAKREGVQIKLYSIIYELIDQVKDAMAGMLEPELRESVIGHAEVKQVFELSRGKVAGSIVTEGRITRTGRARLLRRKQPIYDGGIATLRRFQDDVKEVRAGLECGIRLGDFSEYEPGDIIECYNLEKIPQKLE